MRHAFILLALALAAPLVAGTATNNDESCDIAVQPAATLLLPWFDVDFQAPLQSATRTLFTIANVSPLPQIAQVTLWTDYGYPAFSFPVFLTGYDVQPINLYDLFAKGVIAAATVAAPPDNPSPGSQPAGNGANPNFLPSSGAACAQLPGSITPSLLLDLQYLFTTGKSLDDQLGGCLTTLGSPHVDAIGYVTIDVAATCTSKNVTSAEYFDSVLLYDNVLTGDYQIVVPRGDKSYAQGGPLVHIRAVPEGGPAGAATGTTLPYTFYDRYTQRVPANRTMDRRQPLPSSFAARYIQGGLGGFNTTLKIWREGYVGGDARCSQYALGYGDIGITEVVRFDEHENATIFLNDYTAGLPPRGLPATAAVSTVAIYFPPPSISGDIAGWIYLNLNNGGSRAYSVTPAPPGVERDFHTNTSTFLGPRQSQNWVIVSMFADPSYATESVATALGNGCSPSPKAGARIAPAANVTP